MDLFEMNERMVQFRKDYRIKKPCEVDLRFVSDMYWALGLRPRITLKPRSRPMVAGDIYPEHKESE